MKKKFLLIAAVILVLAMSVSLFVCSSGGDSNSALKDNLEYAKAKVQDYVEWQAKYDSEFYDEMYSKAYLAALAFKPDYTDEQLQTLARYLYVDTITVTDDQGKIVAALPSDEKGKNISDISEKKQYKAILKWIYPRMASEPAKVEGSDEYAMEIAVQRSDETGVVIVSFNTDAYGKVIGANLAQESGNNVVVAQNDVVISSTVDGVEVGKALKDYGVTSKEVESDSFTLKAGDNKLTASADTLDSYTIICAEK